MKRDYYEVLGVSRSADSAQLKSAYRKLAKAYHPDANPGDRNAEKKFKEVGEAYAVLSDPEKRKLYDAYGFDAFEGGGPQQNAQYGQYGGQQTFHFDERDAEELFRSMFGDLGDLFGRGNGSGRFSQFSSFGGDAGFGGRPADLTSHASMTVSFREAALGAEKAIRLSGEDGSSSSLRVRIPAGVEDGKCIRLKQRGRTAPDGRKGDLLIELHVTPDDTFTRKGLDLYTTAEIPYTTAVLGGEATLPTLHGYVNCKIPAGTQSGSKIRLRGKGIRRGGSSPASGDGYVEIRIAVPKQPSPEELRMLRELRDCENRKKQTAKKVS